jgi:hypothetical protein
MVTKRATAVRLPFLSLFFESVCDSDEAPSAVHALATKTFNESKGQSDRDFSDRALSTKTFKKGQPIEQDTDISAPTGWETEIV